MTGTLSRLRGQLPGIVALAVMVVGFLVVRPPVPSAAETASVAQRYAFAPMSIGMPSGYPEQTIRKVNKDYADIDAWISSVGAGIAMNDLDGDGLANDLCVTDPRIDQVVVTPVPGARSGRYAPFALDPRPLPMNHAMAPMGCVPGDFNEDGRMDLLVYMWGRTPIVYLAKAGAQTGADAKTGAKADAKTVTAGAKAGADALTAQAYVPVELVPGSGTGTYTGPQWNSNTAVVDDFDGDGHDDIYIGNYFPDGPVLDDTVSGGVSMNRSLSNAMNGGADFVLRWTGATGGSRPSVSFQCVENVLPEDVSKGWVLAAGANDLDGDMRPELYLAQDHGRDALLHNQSTPGKIQFTPVSGVRTPMTPKSKRIGADSFKGMGVDFGDLNGDGVYDMFVSNITTSYGVQESNFQYMSTARDTSAVRADLAGGTAPWEDRSAEMGTAWSGWGWDVKMADFDNSGRLAIVQADGFVKGQTDRWPQLQELAAANDLVVEHPWLWPNVRANDDIAGHQTLNFFARRDDGGYANVAGDLGLAVPTPTRGIATGDADGDGRLDFAVARQWGEPVFYHNQSPSTGSFLGLRLTRDPAPGSAGSAQGTPDGPGTPAVGTQVTVTTPDGRRLVSRVDGGSGHSGKRSSEVHVGLGQNVWEPVQVRLCWRDGTGEIREQELWLRPGWHSLRLGTQAKERQAA
ncbi:CRTAC1 family protein [Microbispora cellulosiformans]|uniref:CRTAC1 family protein n=1 Tax=Microbispora cellulosiformans TaxID=2614688 RepID=A0A5J5K2Y6_9ACTN|nr:CRTAC1 family protein [Microbispora cellulosiformans]KAA9377605.1 CRTAC1 family protein [Microbispora cellulosiformans]